MSTRERVLAAYERLGGNVSAVARELSFTRGTVQHHLKRAGVDRSKPLAAGRLGPLKTVAKTLPRRGQVKRYILTCAQSCTYLNDRVWENLQALATHYKAKVLCASYTYNQTNFGELSVKRGTGPGASDDVLWFDERVEPLLEKSDKAIELAPGLVWCGNMNTLPTAVRPLTGFETYTGRRSGVFPHSKLSMESVASGKTEATKFNYTTGTVTQLNYIQKKEGIKAERAHSYGGLLVEVNDQGSWWVRQLCAGQNGEIQDLDVLADLGVVSLGNPVLSLTWGDTHTEMIDREVERVAWGPGGMLDVLRPEEQHFHDVLNFGRRSHHDRLNPHRRFELMIQGRELVQQEVQGVAEFLHRAGRPWCRSYVVDSNHDGAMMRWLRETDWRQDLPNAEYYLEAQLRVLQALRRQERGFHLVEWAVAREASLLGRESPATFLREDQSHVICRDEQGGIECGMHGHLGLNGARASPASLAKMGRRANTAHTHTAGIYNGVFTAGTSSKLDLEYNRGPSSWSHSHIVTYPNGQRAIVTMWNGKWRA